MFDVTGTARGTVFSPASLDPSETNGKTLGNRDAAIPPESAPRGAQTKLPPYTFTNAQAGLHRRWQKDREIILDALDSSSFGTIGRQRVKIANCGLSPLFVLKDNGHVGLAPGFCRCRLCPTCQARRGRDLSTRVFAITGTMDSPRFITLTLRSTDHSLRYQLDCLYTAFKELRRSPFWKDHVRGGVAVAEVTMNGATEQWHPHLHVITDGTFMPQAALASEWSRCTGGSMIVDIRAVHDRHTAAKYLCDYVAKPTALTSWPAHGINEFAAAMHARRLLITFGSCHRVKLPVDECETRPAIVEPLCSARRLHDALARGCPAADLARNLLERVGGVAAQCAGIPRPPSGTIPLPLENWEWEWLVEALRTVDAEAEAAPADTCPFPDAPTVAASPPASRTGTIRPSSHVHAHTRIDDFAAPHHAHA